MENGKAKRGETRGILPLPRNAEAMANGRWKMENAEFRPATQCGRQWKMENVTWKKEEGGDKGILPLPRNAEAMANGRWKMENAEFRPATQCDCGREERFPNLILGTRKQRRWYRACGTRISCRGAR
jgi:hypothetical protein